MMCDVAGSTELTLDVHKATSWRCVLLHSFLVDRLEIHETWHCSPLRPILIGESIWLNVFEH